MSIHSVRLHLRILRRLSLAVADQAEPKYHESAIYWWDRNEEIFGRKCKEVVLQESSRNFDQFVAAIPDFADLRNVSETLHVMFLRGYSLKLHGRQVAETALRNANTQVLKSFAGLPAQSKQQAAAL